MAVADDEPALLPPFPQLIDPLAPLTAFSSQIAALHTSSRRSASRTLLLAELVSISVLDDDPLSALCPLLLHCFRRLQDPHVVLSDGELPAAQLLWTALRNLLTQRTIQSCFVRSACFSSFLSCLSSLCSSSAGVADAALAVLGCQLLANSITDNASTQTAFLHDHLHSPHVLSIVRSCPRPCLASLLYVLHTVLSSSAAADSTVLESAGGAALLAEMTLRLTHQQHQQRTDHEAGDDGDEDDDDVDLDGGLLFPSLLHRLFVAHNSLLSMMAEHLQLHHAAHCNTAMAFLLSSLLTLSSCALESESALHCASANCLALLSMMLARYPIDPSERLEDDEGRYAQLQRTLHVDEWTHTCVLLVEHILSSALTLSPNSTSTLPLLHRLFSTDVWYLLIALLASADTPTPPSPHAASPSCSSSERNTSMLSSDIPASTLPSSIPFGFQSDLLRLVSLLCCYPASHPPPFPRLTAVSLLGHTVISATQPMQREYSIVGIRGLCRWEEARQALAALEAQAVAGQREWREQGVQLTLDEQSRKVRMASSATRRQGQGQEQDEHEDGDAVFGAAQSHSQPPSGDMWSIERMAAVRSAGRRVDWGEAEDDTPFDNDVDFM